MFRSSISPRLFGAWALAVFVTGCATPIQKAERYAAQDEWLKAVVEYRKAYSANPRDVEYRSRLKQMELKAADHYYQRGMALMEQGNIDGAILQYQQGLASMNEHSKLQQAMAAAVARKEANALFQEGARHQAADKLEDARKSYQAALQMLPGHKGAQEALAAIDKSAQSEQAEKQALTSRAPITLNFRQTDLKTAFEFIAKSFGLNVMFDEGIKSVPVTLFAQDVTLEQALNLMFATHKVFYKRIGPNTILIIPDTKEKRGQYEDHIVRSFQLSTVKAKDMSEIIKGLIAVKKVIINDELNTLVVRDTDETLKLVERIIEMNDRKPAEIILEVEILEVNRAKAESLGLEVGSSVSAFIPSSVTISAANSVSNAVQNAAVLTLPGVAFRFFKQDVDAKTLANPKVRVLNGKQAKIHVGDRIPIATITRDALQQERRSYDYKDVGIKLTVEPTIHIDNAATVKLGLEVSTLGDNLGSVSEPAYRIGTRNAETFMLLRDGETAILGGLIRDEDRHSRVRIPLLGDIPILGALFSSFDNSDSRTDVLLTITPRVVRGWDLAASDARQFYSGTADSYFNQALFANVNSPARTKAAVATATISNTAIATPTNALTVTPSPAATPAETATQVPRPVDSSEASVASPAEASVASPPGAAAAMAPPIFSFGTGTYDGAVDRELEIKVAAENLANVGSVTAEILFNPQLLGFIRAEVGDIKASDFKAEADAARGTIKLTIDYPQGSTVPANGTVARLVMQGARAGTSYLVFKSPTLKSVQGEVLNAQVRGARVHIK